jgi:sensor histidine kinase regulating citrate/malate metabolism
MDWKMRISDEVEEWVDKETGVHYLVIFDDSTIRCMSPRYDSNGKVMVKK